MNNETFLHTVYDRVINLFAGSWLNCTNVYNKVYGSPVPVPPSAGYFVSHLPPSFIVAIVVACVVCTMTLAIGAVHLSVLHLYITHPYRRMFVVYLACTAPFVSSFALISMFMPRIWFLAHLLSFFYFSIGLYVIICLLMQLVDGRQSMVKKMSQKSSRISVQTPPFCCFFPCLPKPSLETRKIRVCELMVAQTPCVRLLATIMSLILYFEYQDGAAIALKILDFIALPSLLLGIYGCHILVTTVSKLDELIPYRYIVVFRLLDIYFAVFGLQMPVFDVLARMGAFGCGTLEAHLPMLETSFFWKNFATVIESFIVALVSSALLQPNKTALFDKKYQSKYPSCRSIVSTASSTSTRESVIA